MGIISTIKDSINTTLRTAKNGLKAAVEAAPVTLAFSGVAFAGSAVLNSYFPGFDPLGVVGQDPGKILARLFGSMAIGSAISGVIGGYQCFSCETAPATPAGANAPASATGNQPQVTQEPYAPQANLPPRSAGKQATQLTI